MSIHAAVALLVFRNLKNFAKWDFHMRPFEAKWHGVCPRCGTEWSPGDLIRYADEELVCDDCAEDIEYEHEWERWFRDE